MSYEIKPQPTNQTDPTTPPQSFNLVSIPLLARQNPDSLTHIRISRIRSKFARQEPWNSGLCGNCDKSALQVFRRHWCKEDDEDILTLNGGFKKRIRCVIAFANSHRRGKGARAFGTRYGCQSESLSRDESVENWSTGLAGGADYGYALDVGHGQ
jgi:hypothetical protein